jgi:hypothetical protein
VLVSRSRKRTDLFLGYSFWCLSPALAQWRYELSSDIDEKLLRLMVMEEGPEFELSENELIAFVDALV